MLTIERFNYPHLGNNIEYCLHKEFQKWNITSKLLGRTIKNDSSIIKAMHQLDTNHIRYVAYTMQHVIKDRLKDIKNLIDIAKKLNNFIVNHDKYHNLLKETYLKAHSLSSTNIQNVLNPISSDTDTC